MNVLITGGAGFIGSHICKVLAAAGHLPIVVDNLSGGHREAVKWGPLEIADIADISEVRRILKKYQPQAVIHLAALSDIGESCADPSRYYRNNVSASIALLRALSDFQALPLIFSSSCAVYGAPESVSIAEDHPLRPLNPYGHSKLMVERMLTDFNQQASFPWISFRYFNVAGCDPSGEIGEQHEPETHLIPRALISARDGGDVHVWGADYATPDGTCVRDYVHVMDIAEAHLLALDYLQRAGTNCAINLASSRGYSVKEVIATAERVTGRHIAFRISGRRAGDAATLVGSYDQAQKLLGWKPKRAELALQIEDTWRWLSQL